MKWVEVATEPDAIQRVLAGFGLDAGLGHDDQHRAHRNAPRSWHPPPPEQLGFGFG
jgi:hypothetical protein